MSDRWTDRLSEYLDGELGPEERRELEAHLEECTECAEILDDLRRVIESAASLGDREPEKELWRGIEERIRREPPEIQVVTLFDTKRERRRISFSVPQLLAASIVLAVLSAGSVWMALRGAPGTGGTGPVALEPAVVVGDTRPGDAPVRQGGESGSVDAGSGEETPGRTGEAGSASGAASAGERGTVDGRLSAPRSARPLDRSGDAARLVGRDLTHDPTYDVAVADLERILDEGRDRLDPATVQTLEESLRTIDGAIEDARRALAADPANTELNTYLAGTRERKLELLRQASKIVTATT
ncbi:MAG TPA: zf-HC2 domain-containing protein [Longimicrobiaceae bacterium]|nr:zf-HC2 domain-containing protein [Longimicrobiaceae bacterium]